jgi:hypothetical protein
VHGSVLQAWLVAGLVPVQKLSATVVPVAVSWQVTVRVSVPPPQVAEQVPHVPVDQA